MSYFFRRKKLLEEVEKASGNPWKGKDGKFTDKSQDEDGQPHHFTGDGKGGKGSGGGTPVYGGKRPMDKVMTFIHDNGASKKSLGRAPTVSRRDVPEFDKIPKIDPSLVKYVDPSMGDYDFSGFLFDAEKVPQIFRVKHPKGHFLIDTQGFGWNRYFLKIKD